MVPLHDRLGRPLQSLRLSVTDRCNLRCAYCMPEPDYAWLPRERLLRFEELTRLATVFAQLGVRRLRLTGGEPLLRAELPELVTQLVRVAGLEDVALTTNGVRLATEAEALARAGLSRVTVSLDTLQPERFLALTRRDVHAQVLEGLEAARRWLPQGLKLDTVVVRGINDDELGALVEFAGTLGAELRFIEYMDVGGATRWKAEQVVSRAEMLKALEARFGRLTPVPHGTAPAERFRLGDGRTVGIISSMTQPFCRTCDRARLTADGTLYLCLYAQRGLDLRALLRAGATDAELAQAVASAWQAREARGAEERLTVLPRAPLTPAGALREDVRLEMHTRGG